MSGVACGQIVLLLQFLNFFMLLLEQGMDVEKDVRLLCYGQGRDRGCRLREYCPKRRCWSGIA
jgi:hypothetical protein